MSKTSILIWLCSSIFFATSCSKKSEPESTPEKSPEEAAINLATQLRAYYAAHPDFFTLATPDDLPTDLRWQNGEDEEEFASPEAKQGGTLHSSVQDFPRTFRLVGPDSNGSFRRNLLDENAIMLTSMHPNTGNYIPGLATHWALGSDKKTAYYRLDPDARFSDGEPVTADDYLFAFYFFRSEHIVAPWYNDFATNLFSNITKYDDHTISISIPTAKPDLLYRASIRPIPQHFYAEFGKDFVQRYQWKFEPTTGAYEVLPENVKKGQSITLTRVKNWWANDKKFYRHRYNPTEIHFRVIRDVAKAFEAFRKGDLDAFGLSLPEYWYDKLPDDNPEVTNGYIEKVTFYNEVPRPSFALRLNSSKGLLKNRSVRLGLHHAMNWELVIEKVFRGDYQRMRTVADGYGKVSHPSLRARQFSVEKAQEYFTQAGFEKRNAQGILVNAQSKPLEFTITTGYQEMRNVLTILKQEAAKAGVLLHLDILDGTASWKKIQEKKHDIAFFAFGTSVELYPRFWEPFHSINAYHEDGSIKTQSNNITMTADSAIDALIDRYRVSDDMQEITALAHELAKKLHEDGAYIPAFVQPWYRVGHWRWVRFPEGFNVRLSSSAFEHHLHWIDEKIKEETLSARKANKSFSPRILTYDQYKVD